MIVFYIVYNVAHVEDYLMQEMACKIREKDTFVYVAENHKRWVAGHFE
ncbi:MULTISPECIES: hypothetical protein [Lysinibacillus]|nr:MULTISPECIES: hypothetical protein [Lysinibacillus]